MYVEGNHLISGSYDGTIRTWNVTVIVFFSQNGESDTVYKTSGPVNCLKQGEEKTIQAIVGRNIFYQINRNTNKIDKCIKFKKHSISSFFCHEEQLVFGNT